MNAFQVECLRCGHVRRVRRTRSGGAEPAECSLCGYLGWARLYDLSESTRRLLRERPPERRARLRAA